MSRYRVRKGSAFNTRMAMAARRAAELPVQVLFITSTAGFNRHVKCAQRWKSGTFGYALVYPGRKVIIPCLRRP